MSALPGEHLCKKHQGNHSHYAEENCTVCKLEAEVQRLRGALRSVLAIEDDPDRHWSDIRSGEDIEAAREVYEESVLAERKEKT